MPTAQHGNHRAGPSACPGPGRRRGRGVPRRARPQGLNTDGTIAKVGSAMAVVARNDTNQMSAGLTPGGGDSAVPFLEARYGFVLQQIDHEL